MSHIFDALQRSEAERSGVDVSVLPAADDVMEVAERHARSKKRVAGRVERRDGEQADESVPSATVATEFPPGSEGSLDRRRSEVFEQFQSIQTAMPSDSRLISVTDSQSLAAEKFRFLGVRLQQLRRDRPLKKVLVTSTIPQEGKSMVAANLACTMARKAPQRTLLVDGDVRRPTLAQIFGLGKVTGICEWLQGERSLLTSVYHLEGPDLWILPAGSATINPLELLQAAKLSAILDQLTELFDWIIIDSPPVLPLADTSVWIRIADGILLVARQGTTEKRQLKKGLEIIEPKKLIGALLNDSKAAVKSDYYYARDQP